MSESEIYLNALVERNNKVTLVIYKKFYLKIERFILKNNGEKKDAQDIFHDALMYLIIRHKKEPLQIKSFEAFFFTICKNIWRTNLKNKRVIKYSPEILIDRETNLSLFILEQERLEFYQEKFQLLSPNCKEILGSYFNGMSYKEILEDLSYSSINTVRQRVFKCRTKITKLIKDDIRYHKLSK